MPVFSVNDKRVGVAHNYHRRFTYYITVRSLLL